MKKILSITRFENSFLVHRKHYLIILILIIFYSVKSFGQVAAVNPPVGGFAIDGGLKANTPTSPSPFAANQGDWFPGPNGTGGSVFTAAVVANNTATSGKAVDLQASNSDNVFTQGSKFNDYISSLRWGLSGAPDKNDINNALYHISRDGNNDQWVFMAGDRLSTNGTSYIDFEFLQGTITKNANGTFTGSGNAGTSGRTENDMIVSMEYTNGGTKPLVYVYQWKESGGTWSYQLVQNLNVADAFAETNRSGAEADVPYTVFGSNTYQQFAFVEAAINISNLLELSGQACQGLNIQTLWIKTKASSVSTAALKDFMEPIPVGLNFGSSSIDPIGPFCVSDVTEHALSASPTGGTYSGAGIVNGNKFKASDASVGTHLISYSASGCSANINIVVVALPTISGQAIGSVCAGATSASFSYTSTTASEYKIDWDAGGPNDIANYISLPASPFNLTIPGNLAPATYNGTLYIKGAASPGCVNSVAISFTINPNPTADAGTAPASQCFVAGATGNTFNLNGTGTNGNILWTVQSKNPNTLTAVITGGTTLTPSVKVTGPEAGTVTLRLSLTSASCGTATSDVTVTTLGIPEAPDVSYIAPTCLETTFKVTVNDPQNGSTYTLRQLSGGVGPLTKTAPADVVNGKIEFSGLTVGKGYRVTETNSAGCISAPDACGDFSSVEGAARAPSQTIVFDESQASVKAYPNPFSDRVKFLVTSSVAGKGVLEVYNMMGQKVKTVYEGNIAPGTQTFELSLPNLQVASLVYVLRIGDKKMTGKILQINR